MRIITKPIVKALMFWLIFIGLFIGLSLAKQAFPASAERLLHGVAGTLAGLIATVIMLRIDKKSFADIGLQFTNATMRHFFAGVLFGLLLMGLLVVITITAAGVQLERNSNSNLLNYLLLTLPMIPLAYCEELGFRAYSLEVLKPSLGIPVSVIVTSLVFALYHVINGWSWFASFTGPAIWGIVFGMAAVQSKGIAMATGLHYAANLVPAAFAADRGPVNLWVLTDAQQSTGSEQSTLLINTILPSGIILLVGMVWMRWYISGKKRSLLQYDALSE